LLGAGPAGESVLQAGGAWVVLKQMGRSGAIRDISRKGLEEHAAVAVDERAAAAFGAGRIEEIAGGFWRGSRPRPGFRIQSVVVRSGDCAEFGGLPNIGLRQEKLRND